MTTKKFKLNANEFIDLVPQMGGCFATDKITVEGLKVGYMYREESENESDSGWRFFREQKLKIMSTTLKIQCFTT